MGKVQQRILMAGALAVVALGAFAAITPGTKFYPDDPIWRLPKPLNVDKAEYRKLSDIYDYMYMTFGKPGDKPVPGQLIPAEATNTLGEVPDSSWYTNRHWKKRMSIEELVRGPGNENPPATDKPWRVTAAKTEGVTPGFTMKDSQNRTYQVKFDTEKNFEQSTGADVIGSKIFYALGYFTPENYIVDFSPEQLLVGDGTKMVDYRGRERLMRQSDIAGVLARIPQKKDGRYRAVASLFLKGKPLGPFRYHETRTDDPNDVVLHERRRDLRGLAVFCAWVNHNDSKSLNSLDMLVQEDGVQFVKHHLIDFSATLGAEAFEPKSPRAGYVPLFDWTSSAKSFFSLGFYVPGYMRADHPYTKEIGRLESEKFKADEWVPNYYNPTFQNTLPDDAFWAAKQVMAFTEPEVRAMVNTGNYSSAEGVDYLVRSLMSRRENIGRTFFEKVLPLHNFSIEGGRLKFDDLAAKYGFHPARTFKYAWAAFDNQSGTRTALSDASSEVVPDGSGYVVATITGEDAKRTVDVYLRRSSGRAEVVGIERHW